MYIFISHSSTDAAIAQDICNILEASGVQCFLAPRDIRSGYEYASELLYGLDRSDVFLLLLSNKANQSPHVLREVERAVSNATPIIVYKLEDVTLTKSMEYFLMTHQWLTAEPGDYTNLLRGVQEFRKAKGEVVENTTQVSPTSNTSAISNAPVQTAVVNTVAHKKSSKSVLPWIAVTVVITALVIIICILLFKDSNDNVIPPDTGTTTLADSNITSDSSTKQTEESNPTDTTTDATTDTTTNVNNNTSTQDIKLGDTIIMGNYNGADIHWSVINISDDGKKAVIITKNIISFKAFCGSGSAEFALGDDGNHYFYKDPAVADDLEQQTYLWGSNIWKSSHIRTWLNSTSEYVTYDGRGPISSSMADHRNGYHLEAGFLSHFTDEELAAIKETNVETAGNSLTDSDTITTKDKVFLLSKDELHWLTDAGIGLFTGPTNEAANINEDTFYKEYCLEVFKTTSSPWWLRDPLENTVSECYLVSHGAKPDRNYENALAAVEGYGIRPAMTIDLTSDCIKSE